MDNYVIILFKNKKKKKLIKGYKTESNAKSKFESIIKGNKVKFPMYYENAEPCNYEIGLLTNQSAYQKSLFTTDDMGRNNIVKLEGESEYIFINIKSYDVEELIYDWQTDNRITYDEMISTYCKKNTLKNISTLNNKLVIQIDEEFYLFSLKNTEDSVRLLQTMEHDFMTSGRRDAFFVRDISTVHRKWMYDLLERYGFDRKKLYRQNTTYSKRN